MNNRPLRLAVIAHMIQTEVIRTQQDIVDMLYGSEFETTQASVSRDLKDLKAACMYDGTCYRYILVDHE